MAVTVIPGILIGMVLGLTIAGGPLLSVPALVFSLGWTMLQAAPVALVAVATALMVTALFSVGGVISALLNGVRCRLESQPHLPPHWPLA